MAAHFVNAADLLNHAVGSVQSLDGFVAGSGNGFDDALIRLVSLFESEDALAGRIKNYFAKRQPAQLSIFVEQPRDELMDRRLFAARPARTWRGRLRRSDCAQRKQKKSKPHSR